MLLSVLLATVALGPSSGTAGPEAPVVEGEASAGEASAGEATVSEPAEGGEPAEPALPEPPELPEPPPTGATPPPPGPASLQWSAPIGCPTTDELRGGIERRLGRTLEPSEAEIDARIDATEGGYRLSLRTTVDGVADERTLDADDCGALADATALIVALAVDPVAVAGALELWNREASEQTPPSEPVARPALRRRAMPESSEPSAEPPAQSPRGLAGGIMRVGGGVGLGAVPGVTGALSLAGGLRWQRARLELEGSYWIPRRSEPIDGASVRVQLGTAAVRGCGVLAREQLEAPLCGGLQVGGMRGDGEGAPGARSAQGLWLALEAGVGLSWWFQPRWALAGGFVAAVPLVSAEFDLDTEPPVQLFEPSAVAGRLWLGIEFRLNSP